MGNSIRLSLNSPTESYTHVSPENNIRIGRSNKCEFTVPREDLSREHCLLEATADGYYITDLGSKNGVAVDRIQIQPHIRTKVDETSVIVLANIYTLNINSLEIFSKKDIVAKSRAPAKENTETVSFSLDLDVTSEKKLPVFGKRAPKRRSSSEAETANYDVIKMAVGFILVVSFVIYHALGR